MREIKFRGFDKETKTMFEITDMERGAGWITHRPKDQKLISNYKEEDFNLMQFTGLLDKNGKEIYEGDIIKSDGSYPLEVYWMGIAWGVRWDDNGSEEESIICDDGGDMEIIGKDNTLVWMEIIGNIYENPELLQKERDR